MAQDFCTNSGSVIQSRRNCSEAKIDISIKLRIARFVWRFVTSSSDSQCFFFKPVVFLFFDRLPKMTKLKTQSISTSANSLHTSTPPTHQPTPGTSINFGYVGCWHNNPIRWQFDLAPTSRIPSTNYSMIAPPRAIQIRRWETVYEGTWLLWSGEGFVSKTNGLVVDNMTDFFAHTLGGRKFVLVESVE